MLIEKRIRLRMVLQIEGFNILLFLTLATSVYLIDRFTSLPIDLPISIAATLGTAVAILLGFKNNAAYERWWEARKIWGAIVNSSRFLGAQLITYVDRNDDVPPEEHQRTLRELVHRHLGYVNILRCQLRDLPTDQAVTKWLPEGDALAIRDARNKATLVLTRQSESLRELCAAKRFGQFRLFELMATIGALFDHQGKAERIKGTPLMRHYSVFTTAFVWIFVILLPLCFVDALGWRMVPLVVVISVIFTMLERAGTFTETPFTEDFNCVSLDAICRTIEIDMLQQIGETDIPAAIEPVDGVLM